MALTVVKQLFSKIEPNHADEEKDIFNRPVDCSSVEHEGHLRGGFGKEEIWNYDETSKRTKEEGLVGRG